MLANAVEDRSVSLDRVIVATLMRKQAGNAMTYVAVNVTLSNPT